MSRRDQAKALIRIIKVPNVGEYELFYHRDNKYFFTQVEGHTFSGPTEQEVEKAARAYIGETLKLEWKRFIVIDTSSIGKSTNDDCWGEGPIEREHSMKLKYWRVEIAKSLNPKRPGRIQRRFHEDKRVDGHWTESDERQWATGLSARSVFESSEDRVEFPYDPELWDALERMAAMLNRQREALGKLLGSKKNIVKLLLAQREKLPALPAPKRKRRA